MRRTLLATIALLLVVAVPAYPHGGGAIRLATTQVPGGGTVGLTGEKLEKNSDLSLELRGTLDNNPVGRVHSDANGKFSTNLLFRRTFRAARTRCSQLLQTATSPPGPTSRSAPHRGEPGRRCRECQRRGDCTPSHRYQARTRRRK